ncbi:hypothetical protein [Streptomyces cavernae]|uniref:hypothetical protein n=1 Tax=Streptomyces cavernae TaxID=2259034 RepID=UPI000FEB88D6|nr:hypothetical protein [Streptomyces cavernae]
MTDHREETDGGGRERVTRIVTGRQGEAAFTHGPVKQTSHMHTLEVVTFSGSEESDVLHAAGSWMAEYPLTLIVSLNWRWDHPDEDHSCWVLDMTVDHEPGMNQTEEWWRAVSGDPRLRESGTGHDRKG